MKITNRVIIIHHNDADGRCAAAIAGLSSLCRDYSIEYIEADYGMLKGVWPETFVDMVDRSYDTVDHVSKVFIVDFSLPEHMVARLETLTELHWIDHHASAKLFTYHHLKGLRDFTDKGRSGCELAWEYCFPAGMAVEGEFGRIPAIVKLIGDYDTWRLEYEDRCKPLIIALDAEQYKPDDPVWRQMFGLTDIWGAEVTIVATLIERGRIMIGYRDGYALSVCESYGFETVFEGLNCYAVNLFKMGSMAFGDKLTNYDACIAFVFDGERFTVSLYSDKPAIDCSEICRRHGGGGHKGAAGFTCDMLPFKK